MDESTPLRVLCIEDDPDDLVLVRLATRHYPRPLHWQCTDNAQGVTAALAQGVDFVLSDYHLGGYSPLRAIAEIAARGLEQRIKLEAKSMADKYLEPPHTTDFAILFLPTEGLYAEVLRRPGLMEVLQREYRVTLAGPTTLMAMLNSLQMGFRTLALEKRSSEVWQVLGAVKTEFGKFGDVLAKVKSQTQTVLNTLDSAEVRSRAMGRALKAVEALPADQAGRLLPADPADRDGA